MTSQRVRNRGQRGNAKKLNRFAFRTAGIIMFAGAVLGLTLVNVRAGTSDFSFGAVGDSGTSANAQSVFSAIGGTASTDTNFKFVQHVGDYSYAEFAAPSSSGTTAATNAWCQLVKDKINVGAGLSAGNTLGENFPIMLATGNHEATLSQPNPSVYGSIKTSPYHNDQIEDLKTCLPNQFTSSTTLSPHVGGGGPNSNYAREYYYDYPAVNPIARFIVTTPGTAYNMTQTDGNGLYDYSVGSDHYNWLSNSIDSARSSGIKWVIVTNHTNYIAASNHEEDISSDYFNLLLEKRVDLILQGHNHVYQRSKQLTNNIAGCTTLTVDTYDTDCVASDGGASNVFTKGQGSILAIVGMGGDTLYTINTSDGDYNYFESNMGAGTNDSFGFLKVNVTDTAMTANYVKGDGQTSSFADTFSIQSPPDTTSPTVSLTAPTVNATLSGTTTLTATATDDTAVTKVEFYEGATKLGEDTTSPYTYSWDTTTVANGAVSLTAKAYDAAGNVGTSTPAVSAAVNNASSDTTAPTVSLTAPTVNATLSGTTTLTATATDNVAVTKVEFYEGTNKLGEDATSPYTYDWNTTTATNGVVSLTAKAYDAAANVGTSTPAVSAAVNNASSDTTAPTVSLTAPTVNATLSGTTTLTATATDNVAVTKVEFYEGTNKLGEDATSPYTYDWNTTTATNGSHSLTAKAYDAAANNTSSGAVTVTVTNTTAPTTTVDLGTKTSSEPTPISKAVMAVTAGTCNDFSSAITVPSTGVTVAESGVSILGGFDFTIDCTAVSGTAALDITLGQKYDDTSKLRAYKKNGTTVTDVTKQVTFRNTSTATVITYTLLDGAAFDADGVANSTIEDPLYVGVLGETTTTPTTTGGAGATTTTSEKLADTGTKIALIVSGSLALFIASVIIFSRAERRYRLFR